MLVKYNPSKVPQPFGLQNNGALCYFNSLVQCLASCSAFAESLDNDNSEIATAYTELLSGDDFVKSAYTLATLINNWRNEKQLQWNISPHRQEDIHEGFILMMEALNNQHDYIFNTRYALVVYCCECEHKIVVPNNSCPTELAIEIPIGADFTTQEQYENYIMVHQQTPEDYKCENCGVKNTPNNQRIHQRYKIARLSSVIVLLLKGNQQMLLYGRGRHQQWFPQELQFNSMNDTLKYNLVAQAEQFGSLGGGHYTATGLRQSVTHFNDSNFGPSGFNTSQNTYILFYHLI